MRLSTRLRLLKNRALFFSVFGLSFSLFLPAFLSQDSGYQGILALSSAALFVWMLFTHARISIASNRISAALPVRPRGPFRESFATCACALGASSLAARLGLHGSSLPVLEANLLCLAAIAIQIRPNAKGFTKWLPNTALIIALLSIPIRYRLVDFAALVPTWSIWPLTAFTLGIAWFSSPKIARNWRFVHALDDSLAFLWDLRASNKKIYQRTNRGWLQAPRTFIRSHSPEKNWLHNAAAAAMGTIHLVNKPARLILILAGTITAGTLATLFIQSNQSGIHFQITLNMAIFGNIFYLSLGLMPAEKLNLAKRIGRHATANTVFKLTQKITLIIASTITLLSLGIELSLHLLDIKAFSWADIHSSALFFVLSLALIPPTLFWMGSSVSQPKRQTAIQSSRIGQMLLLFVPFIVLLTFGSMAFSDLQGNVAPYLGIELAILLALAALCYGPIRKFAQHRFLQGDL